MTEVRETQEVATQRIENRDLEVRPETDDAATVVIKPGRDWQGHQPGQYVRVGVDVDGIRLWRTYSLTHGPRPDGLISITVKAVPDGKVSNHLVHAARPGTLVHAHRQQALHGQGAHGIPTCARPSPPR